MRGSEKDRQINKWKDVNFREGRVIFVQNSKYFQVTNVGNGKNIFKLQFSKICYCQ